MKGKLLFPLLIMAGCICSAARIISPDNKGDIFRAEAMLENENYIGALDQLALLNRDALTASETEQAEWIRCRALVHTDSDEAVGALKCFLEKYQASVLRFNAMMLLGDCLLESSPLKALGIYSDVDTDALTDAQRAELAYHKGYALLEVGDLDRAEPFFTDALKDSPWDTRAKFYLGYIAYTRNDYDRAKQLFEASDRATSPGNMADFYLAQIYYAEGDYPRALGNARTLMQRSDVSPEYTAEATRIAGESLFQTGDTKQGLKLLRNYVAMTDSPARSALYLLGTDEFNNGHPAEAIDLLQRVVEDSTDDAMTQSAYLYIGQSLMERGDRDAALLAFDKALKMDNDRDVQEAAFYNYAVAKFSGARIPFGSSAATFEEFLRRFPNGRYAPAVQEYLVEGYLTDGNYETALASINRMSNPGSKVLDAKQKVLYALGTQALAKENPDGAVSYLREAQAMKRNNKAADARIALSLGEALAQKGQYKEAVSQLSRYIAEAPAGDVNRPLARYDIAYAYFQLKDFDKSATNFTQFIASPGNLNQTVQTDALNRLADSQLYLGQLDKAAQNYQRAYDSQPASGDYPLYQMAIIEGYQRQHSEKIVSLKKLLEEFPSSSLVPDALLQMTESYIQIGDNDHAIATYRRLVAEYPSTEQGRQGYLQLALTLLNTGQRKEAVTAYKDVVTLYPTSVEARMAIDELKRISAEDGTLPDLAAWLRTIDNAPQLDIVESDRLTFEAAEKTWITEQDPARLEKYLLDFPKGSFRPRALGYLTDYAVSRDNHRDVIDFTSEIVGRYPDSPQAEPALMAKATAEYALGESRASLESWTALEQRASSAHTLNEARTGIMRSARDLGDHARVISAAEALLSSSSIGAGIRNEAEFARAFALARTGRTDEAALVWKQLAQNPADIYGAKSAYYLSELLFEEGQTDRARQHTESFVNSGSPHSYWIARGFILLSDIYMHEGKTFEAREYLKSLRENYPGTETDIFSLIDERLNN